MRRCGAASCAFRLARPRRGRDYAVAILGLENFDLAEVVQTLGKHRSKYEGMCWSTTPRQCEGSRVSTASSACASTGRGADGDDLIGSPLSAGLISGLSMTSALSFGRFRFDRTGMQGANVQLSPRCAPRERRRSNAPQGNFLLSSGLVMIDTAPAASASKEACVPRSASEEQTITGVCRSAMIFLEEGDAVHARHFHVDYQHVRPVLAHAVEGKWVGGGAYHLDLRCHRRALERPGQPPPSRHNYYLDLVSHDIS